ncbi:MAG: hypothetical protein GWP09_02650, partial [Nitrospiraceae bacterium]|nr:hypothetical protein [Nitrospiraceae bacterium]
MKKMLFDIRKIQSYLIKFNFTSTIVLIATLIIFQFLLVSKSAKTQPNRKNNSKDNNSNNNTLKSTKNKIGKQKKQKEQVKNNPKNKEKDNKKSKKKFKNTKRTADVKSNPNQKLKTKSKQKNSKLTNSKAKNKNTKTNKSRKRNQNTKNRATKVVIEANAVKPNKTNKEKANKTNSSLYLALSILFLIAFVIVLVYIYHPSIFNSLNLSSPNNFSGFQNNNPNNNFNNKLSGENTPVKYIINLNGFLWNTNKINNKNTEQKETNNSTIKISKNNTHNSQKGSITVYTSKTNNSKNKDIILNVIATEGQLIDINQIIAPNTNMSVFYYYPFNKTGQWQTSIGDANHYLINISFYNETTVINKKVDITIKKRTIFPQIDIPDIISSREGNTVQFTVNLIDGHLNSNNSQIIEPVNINNYSNYKISVINMPKSATFKNNVFNWKIPYNFVKRNWFSKLLLRFLWINTHPKRSIKIGVSVRELKTNASVTKWLLINVNNTVLPPVINVSPILYFKEGTHLDLNKIKSKIYDPNGNYIKLKISGWHPSHILTRKDIGLHNITILADNHIKSTSKTIFIDVIERKTIPSLNKLKNLTIYEGETAREKIQLKGINDDINDSTNENTRYIDGNSNLKITFQTPIKYQFINNTFIYKSDKYLLNNKPKNVSEVTFPVNITVSSDNLNLSSKASFTIKVKRVNYAPLIINHSEKFFRIEEGKVVNLSLVAKDINHYPLTYELSLNFYNPIIKTKKSWMLFNFTTLGEKHIRVKVSNGYNSTSFEFIGDVYREIPIISNTNTGQKQNNSEKNKINNSNINSSTSNTNINITSNNTNSEPTNTEPMI